MVGLVEEFVKILGVLVIARRHKHDAQLDGMILGAAAGMGFAALESLGYSFTVFFRSQGSLSSTVAVTLLRGLLSPLGHGTGRPSWSGCCFAKSSRAATASAVRSIGAFVMVVLLHALWDGLPAMLSFFTPSGQSPC